MRFLRTASTLVVITLALALGACAHKQETTAQPGPTPTPQPILPKGDSVDGSPHVLLGIPTDADPSDDLLINRKYWVASYNPKRLVPNWVSWQLVAEDIGGVERSKKFYPDTDLPSEIRVDPKDYTNSGYDRGHMCNSKDRTSTVEANRATFLMSNMQPQLHVLNAGPWENLENYERSLATQGKQVEIIAGGVFTNSTQEVGRGIAVPASNFKIVVVMTPGQTAADVTESTPVYAVIMPNSDVAAHTPWTQYLVSIDEIEQKTGYDFLSKVPEAVQKVIEAKVATAP